jgi:hypothetical protein
MRISLKCPIQRWIMTPRGMVTVATCASTSFVIVDPFRTTSTLRLPLPIGMVAIVCALISVYGQQFPSSVYRAPLTATIGVPDVLR